MITVLYVSIDHHRQRKTFKTLAGARKYAQMWVGEFPSIGNGYAISDDGIGKIVVSGVSLSEIFPGCE